MKKLFVALLLLVGAAAAANLVYAAVEDGLENGAEGVKLTTAKSQSLVSRAAKLRSAAVGDTTYVGYTPGMFNAANNWWSIGAGHSPANSNTPAFRRAPAQGGMWDFEPTGGAYINGDSLQGCWPLRRPYVGTGGQTRPDWNRVWWAIESGNTANYRINNITGRTFGVTGVWHVDDMGAPVPAPATAGHPAYVFNNAAGATPTWTPIAGTSSAWMGLRAHNDVRYTDPITLNGFNSDVLWSTQTGPSTSASGTDDKFPGYGSQMDQFLYRDIDMSGFTGSDLAIDYKYRLDMSTGFGTAAASRTGWFDKDPTQVAGGGASNSAVGNFISSSDAGNTGAPRDSFTVYIGAPVGNTFKASNGNTYPVFDPQRRWFSEILRVNEAANLYQEIDRDTGIVALATKHVVIPNAVLSPMLAASGGKIRLVFRVHTNRGFDSQGTAWAKSNTAGDGAAMLDDVTYAISGGPASPLHWGDFDDPAAIDNNVAVDAVAAWKATGKPPSALAHTHPLATLQYDDICGQPGDASRVCNLIGVVCSVGDHDNSEAAGSTVDGTADRERVDMISTPTIQLCSNNGSWPNPVGFAQHTTGVDSPGDAYASEDYYIDLDIYAGVFDPFTKGNFWWGMAWNYPALDRNGNKSWNYNITFQYIIYNPDQQCFRDFLDHTLRAYGMFKWSSTMSESPDYPDSMRVAMAKYQYCFRFGVSTGCSPTDGCYFDNMDLMLIDGTPAPLSASIWDLFNDAFPQNETAGLPAYATKFDTCTALVKSGLNIAPSTGDTRFDVPGDSAAVTAAPAPGGAKTRVDMIFRILPGPGNYAVIGRPDLGTLVKNPADPLRAPIAGAVANSSNFWESYLANNGPYGTPGGHAGGKWDPNVWNSARMDTVEASGLFSVQGRGILGGPGDPQLYNTFQHESEMGIAPDPNTTGPDPWGVVNIRGGLGISRHRCFLASAGAATTDIDCVHNPPSSGAGYDLSYVSAAVGYDGNPNTIEGTKIIPDGLLTPGSSVEYFFRKEDSNNIGTMVGMMPDTNIVVNQAFEGSVDGHRWQYFSVLPDRWKSTSYKHPVYGQFGLGEACLLVYDNHDRRGDERGWVGVADTIGATKPLKYGAHNGWHATGTQDPDDPAARVYVNGGIPGTTWDFYNMKASESSNSGCASIGNRLAFRDPTNPQINNKVAKMGPTPEMMGAFYKMLYLFSGDLNTGVLGPYLNRSQDDCRLIREWLQAGDPVTVNRAFHANGDGFVESNWGEGPGSPQDDLNVNVLGLTLRSNSYTLLSGNTERTPDMIASPALASPASQDIYGVQNICLWTNDVLERTAGLIGQTSDLVKYEDAGPGPFPLTLSVSKVFDPAQPWISDVDGVDLMHIRSRFDTDTKGRHRFFFEMYSNIFGQVCTVVGTPVIPMDVPTLTEGKQYVELASGNPMRTSNARINFALAKDDLVDINVFDVSGRMVKSIATGQRFSAGAHTIAWDGTDNSGSRVARGVYFTQVKFRNSNFSEALKLTVLK